MMSNSLVKLADRTRAEHPGIRGGAACTTCPGLDPGSGERASPRRVGKILAGPSMVGTARRRFCPPLVGHTSAPLPTLRSRAPSPGFLRSAALRSESDLSPHAALVCTHLLATLRGGSKK